MMSFDEYFMKIARVTSERSPCNRLKVGCVLVKCNRIVSQGYNGFLKGCPHESVVKDDHEQAIVHAEQNSITFCAKNGISSDKCTAYITHYPCIICCRIMLSSGVRRIIYEHDYKNDELVKILCDQVECDILKFSDIIDKLIN